jgi:outer membrane protein TolC
LPPISQSDGDKQGVTTVAYAIQQVEEVPAPVAEPFAQSSMLEVEPLVAEVLARNPDVRSAVSAWRAASARYPQSVALDDPMFGYMLGPASWGSPNVDSAYAVQASQKIPWPGKRELRGNISQAQANASYFDVGEERLRITQVARMAYYEYFLAYRQSAVLRESQSLVKSFSEIAKRKYEAAAVEQQDVLLADVELAELERRMLEATRRANVARARLNTLLLVAPEAPLPPPPGTLPVREVAEPAEALRATAIAQRPDLAAQAARIRAERYALSLTCKEFYPDLEVVGRYDAFWQHPEEDLRPMVGMNLNMPVYKQKRWAAVREARARLAQQQAAFDAKTAEVAFEVEQARQRVLESRQSLAVFENRILPAAKQSVDAGKAGYTAGSLDFLRLVESQRQSLSLQEQYYAAMAEYQQRLAELKRAVGTPAP